MRYFLLIFLSSVILWGASGMENSIENDFEDEYAQTQKSDFDPLKGYNELMTNINDKFYTHMLFPIAKGYKAVVPKKARTSVSNFFYNLLFPVRLVNNILQFKLKNSMDESGRFLINSTLGIAGLFDVATKKFKMKFHNEDFGQTLGFYGFGGGFHIVWPVIGDSNLRDSIGLAVDSFMDPKVFVQNRFYNLADNKTRSVWIEGYDILNQTSFKYKKYEAVKKGNVLLYPVLKDLYEEKREKLIKE